MKVASFTRLQFLRKFLHTEEQQECLHNLRATKRLEWSIKNLENPKLFKTVTVTMIIITINICPIPKH